MASKLLTSTNPEDEGMAKDLTMTPGTALITSAAAVTGTDVLAGTPTEATVDEPEAPAARIVPIAATAAEACTLLEDWPGTAKLVLLEVC